MENNDITTLMVLLSKLKLATVISTLIALMIATVTDSSVLVFMVYVLILVHIGTGFAVNIKLWYARGVRPKFNDAKFFRTGMKLIWFPVVIMCTQMIQNGFEFPVSLAKFAAGYVALHDLKGIFQNVFSLTGIDFWDALGEVLKSKLNLKNPNKKKEESNAKNQ